MNKALTSAMLGANIFTRSFITRIKAMTTTVLRPPPTSASMPNRTGGGDAVRSLISRRHYRKWSLWRNAQVKDKETSIPASPNSPDFPANQTPPNGIKTGYLPITTAYMTREQGYYDKTVRTPPPDAEMAAVTLHQLPRPLLAPRFVPSHAVVCRPDRRKPCQQARYRVRSESVAASF
ncbi:hypothetical protein KCP73_14075 [Salmonella enterica subsp. enterica]|nr:hypothetical protein KCP73_14075 [Salmonella enterica subsp. enterica]